MECEEINKKGSVQNVRKTYTNGEVTIVWEPQKCTRSGICVKDNRDVFKPKERPWIKPLNSATDKIIETVKKCPSGALTYFVNDSRQKKEEQGQISS